MRTRLRSLLWLAGAISLVVPSAPIAAAQENSAPVMEKISAEFVQAEFSTYYETSAADIDGDTLTFSWKLDAPEHDPTCDNFEFITAPTANPSRSVWHHGGEVDGCNHSSQDSGTYGHTGTVTAMVTDGTWYCHATYFGSTTTEQPGSPVCSTTPPDPDPDPVVHERSISIKFNDGTNARNNGLVVFGRLRVPDGFADCRSSQPVNIQRRISGRWVTKKTTKTERDGDYRTALSRDGGRYRVRAPESEVTDTETSVVTDRCAAASREGRYTGG